MSTEPAVGRSYTIVLMSDLGSGGRLPGLHAVESADLSGLMATARPQVAISIKPAGLGEVEASLSFSKLSDLAPAAFLNHLNPGRWRLGLRKATLDRLGGATEHAALEQACATAAAADATLAWTTGALTGGGATATAPPAGQAKPVAPPPGGSILDMVDEPSRGPNIAEDVARLAAGAAGAASQIPAGQAAACRALLKRLDQELCALADAVLRHADFRRLEAAWRGLAFLVQRVDLAAGVRIEVVDAARGDALDRLVEHVIQPAFDGQGQTPGLVLLDYPIGNTPPDLESLDQVGQQVAALPVPAVFPIDAAFFNVKSLRLVKNLPNLSGLIGDFQFAKWRTLRDQPHARWLAPVVGRFVLRAPYAPAPDARDFMPAETVASAADLLWGGGHLGLGVCAARAFARHGWPMRMFGPQAGKVENLPVVTNPADAGNPWGPGDLVLPDAKLDELPPIGMNALHSVLNADYCVLIGGVSAARPVKTAENTIQQAALEISLPYQQFSSAISTFLSELLPDLRGLAENEVQMKLLGSLQVLLKLGPDDADAVQVGVGQAPDQSGRTLIQVRLTPPVRIVPGGLHVEFSFAI